VIVRVICGLLEETNAAPNGRLAGILSDRSSISHHGVIKSSAFSDVKFDASVVGSSDIQGWFLYILQLRLP
jgi:hypothetical protein